MHDSSSEKYHFSRIIDWLVLFLCNINRKKNQSNSKTIIYWIVLCLIMCRWDFKLCIMLLRLFLLSRLAPYIRSALWNSSLIQVGTSWSAGPLLFSGISQAIGLSWGPVSHTKLMSPTGNDTFSRICHSKPPQTHVISPIHSQRDCLEMHHSFKSQWA